MNYLFQQPLAMSETEFNRSCLEFEDYPRNLIYRPSSDTTLKAFADRLRDASPELLCEEDKVLVPYCDLRSDLTGQFCLIRVEARADHLRRLRQRANP